MLDSIFSSLFVGLIAGAAKHFYNFSVAELLGIVSAANSTRTLAVLDSLRHSQVPVSFGPLDSVILSPHMHQLHHSVKLAHWDKNMGNQLSIWDWCFRTGFKPEKGEALRFGASHFEDAEYESVQNCYILPILKGYRLCRRRANTDRAGIGKTQPMQSAEPEQS
jgi:sterol desaturase/sphingolipid hydroxylase (fatty acid hydroxylase superfamily)